MAMVILLYGHGVKLERFIKMQRQIVVKMMPSLSQALSSVREIQLPEIVIALTQRQFWT